LTGRVRFVTADADRLSINSSETMKRAAGRELAPFDHVD
jgi:hypothetical protein